MLNIKTSLFNSNICSFPLRDYQVDAIKNIYTEWQAGKRKVLLQLPTGSGKTVIFSEIVRLLVADGDRVLVLVHREELLTQARDKIEAATVVPIGIIKAGYPSDPSAAVQVATIQSLMRRTMPPAGLVIIDEAHHSAANTYQQVIEYYGGSYLLGVTATPRRIDGQGFRYTYDSLVLGPSVKRLIDQGYLCDYKLIAAENSIDLTGVETVAGEFNQKHLAEAVDNSLILGDVVDAWREFTQGKKTVVFAVDVEHSQETTQAFLGANISAEHLDGETSTRERQAILGRFRRGETLVLCNVNIVTEGFDLPDIEVIQCVRPTASVALWQQMIGRSLRPSPGKERAIIIDHTNNWMIHGLPDDDHAWSLDPISIKPTILGSRACVACRHVFKPFPYEWEKGEAICPNCQAEVALSPPKTKAIQDEVAERERPEQVSAAMGEVDKDADPVMIARFEEAMVVAKERNYKPSWAYVQFFKYQVEHRECVNLGTFREIARRLNYKPGWAFFQIRDLEKALKGGA